MGLCWNIENTLDVYDTNVKDKYEFDCEIFLRNTITTEDVFEDLTIKGFKSV